MVFPVFTPNWTCIALLQTPHSWRKRKSMPQPCWLRRKKSDPWFSKYEKITICALLRFVCLFLGGDLRVFCWPPAKISVATHVFFLHALGFLEHALQPAPPLEFNEFTICWVVAMLSYLTTSCQVSQMTNDSLRQIAAQTLPKSMTHFNLHFVCWCFMKF